MPKIAYQTYIVIVLTVVNFALSQIQGNAADFPLGPTWRVIVIPSVLLLVGLALNQLKPVGSAAPGTVETKTVEIKETPPTT